MTFDAPAAQAAGRRSEGVLHALFRRGAQMNWERVFLDNVPLVDRATAFVCRKYGLVGADADDFASAVWIKLIEDDYAVFRTFENKCALSTYLTIVIQRHYAEVERTEEMPAPASGRSAEDELLTGEREAAARRTSKILNQELDRFPAEDRLIMKLRFIDAMKVSTMAGLLHADQKQLYRRIDQLVAALREVLPAAGVA